MTTALAFFVFASLSLGIVTANCCTTDGEA
jgi:hypothetical protein